MESLNPYPDPRGQTLPRKIENSFKKFSRFKCRIFSFESLDVLYGVLGISKLQILVKKRKEKKNSAVFFPSIFGHHSPSSVSGSGFTLIAGSGSIYPQHADTN
jgi:hypothetical protein